MSTRHNCTTAGTWSTCVVCDGRIHLDGCTTKRRSSIDCCPTRHKLLFDRGQVRGIWDSSFLMWSPEHPEGIHDGDPMAAGKE